MVLREREKEIKKRGRKEMFPSQIQASNPGINFSTALLFRYEQGFYKNYYYFIFPRIFYSILVLVVFLDVEHIKERRLKRVK